MNIVLTCVLLALGIYWPGASQADGLETATVQDANFMEIAARSAYSSGDNAKATALLERVLAIRDSLPKQDLERIEQTLTSLATIYTEMGEIPKALKLRRRDIALKEKTLSPNDPDMAVALANLAVLHKSMGDSVNALALLERACAFYDAKTAQLDPWTRKTVCFESVGSVYLGMGDYARALPLYQDALAFDEKMRGPEHSDTADSLSRVADVYELMGDYGKTLPLRQRSLAIHEEMQGPEHLKTAEDLASLAGTYIEMDDFSKSLPFIQRALEIREKVLGPDHPVTAQSLSALGSVYIKLGDRTKPLSLYQRALIIREKALGSEHLATSASLADLADLHTSLGDYSAALPLYRRALAISEKVYGQGHPYTAGLVYTLGKLLAFQHNYQESLPLLLQAQGAVDKDIENVFAVATEQQRLQFVQSQSGGYMSTLSLIHQRFSNDATAVRAGFDMVLLRKGIVFDAQSRQNETIAKSLDWETRQKFTDFGSQRAMLAKLMQAKPEQMSAETYQQLISELHQRISDIEAQLASKSALVAQNLKQRYLPSSEIAKYLDTGTVLIEFVRIQNFDWNAAKWSNAHRYLAFVLHSNGTVQMVDLGDADQLDQSIQISLNSLISGGSDVCSKPAAACKGSAQENPKESIRHTAKTVRLTGGRNLELVGGNRGISVRPTTTTSSNLYELLWQPIAAAVGNSGTVVFSPDGLLNLVPFAALQDPSGNYLIESRNISYVTSGRDLAKIDIGIKPESELFLAADPAFDLKAKAAVQRQIRGTLRSASIDYVFAPLPGTAIEAKEVPIYFPDKKVVVTGVQATENVVLSAHRPRVMHLATHGFFLPDQASLDADTQVARETSIGTHVNQSRNYENPMVRSGLAFAGANHASKTQGSNDGLLTALEVSGMDLHGTDLVVLSACETGIGEVKSGEGVFGLRRAFALAGTNNLVMSLWPVDDDITAKQMQTFYKLYGGNADSSVALREAQLSTIATLRQQTGVADPALWAPFILQRTGKKEWNISH